LRGSATIRIAIEPHEVSWMKTPVVLVTATLTLAILLAALFLIATGTRGEDAFAPDSAVVTAPAAK
jgi:hypothetical protein